MASPVADIFLQAAELNRQDARRHGNVVLLESGVRVILAGDIHGHRDNLNRIIRYAALESQPACRLILQEIIHGPSDHRAGHDRSAELLMRAARLKRSHPQQVLFVLGNHDVAQVTGNEITKDGRGAVAAFSAAMAPSFGDHAQAVADAVKEFILSMPLAVRCPNGVICVHSLPSPARLEQAGVEIFSRQGYTDADLRRGGAAYEWTWGRKQTAEELAVLRRQLDANFFLIGHKPVEEGWERLHDDGLILTSHHQRGCIAVFDSDQPLDARGAASIIQPIASL